MAKRIHIIVVEPSAIVRCGVTTLLQRATSLSADIADVSDVAQLSNRSYESTPDLLIINPLYLGAISLSQLKAEVGSEETKVIALQRTFVDQSQLQGFDGVVSIYDTIETIIDKILEVTKVSDEQQDAKKELSVREKEIIVCVVKGMTNKQIADTLCISTHTVIAHRRNIASKLQIHSPSGLTIYAIVNKLVDLADIKNSISQSREED